VAGIVRGYEGSLRPLSTLQTISPEHANKNRLPVLKSKRSSILPEKTGSDSEMKIDPRMIRIQFQSRSWLRFQMKNRGSILPEKTRCDFFFKIAIR